MPDGMSRLDELTNNRATSCVGSHEGRTVEVEYQQRENCRVTIIERLRKILTILEANITFEVKTSEMQNTRYSVQKPGLSFKLLRKLMN